MCGAPILFVVLARIRGIRTSPRLPFGSTQASLFSAEIGINHLACVQASRSHEPRQQAWGSSGPASLF